jgi:intracellular sulfur oxidation DsrE/DsrF family protein
MKHAVLAILFGGIRHVDAGVVELMMKQRAGWSYIRP